MKILYIADLASPIAQNWIRNFCQSDDVAVISSQRVCELDFQVRVYHVPFAISFLHQFSTTQMARTHKPQTRAAHLLRVLNRRLNLQALWQSYAAPLDAMRMWARVQKIADAFKPDLVHALRIPTEGFSAAKVSGAPLVLSVWGNDFTLHANRSPLTRHLTRVALQRASGLHADCARDIRLARAYGYAANGATLVIPTAGGISQRIIDPARVQTWRQELNISAHAPIVINPRGTRAYVCLQEFFQSIPLVLRACPDVIFICVAMQGHPLVTQWVKKLGIEKSVRLLPVVSQADLAALFNLAAVMVSPTTHDGTPNTLLEALAQGAFPVASDLESIREWIVPGENGLLFDPTNPNALADVTLCALNDDSLRETARVLNQQRIRESANYDQCMQQAREFYAQVIEDARDGR